jgi:PEGA domain
MRATTAIAWVVVLALTAAAHADEGSREDARRLFLAGRQAFQEGRLDVAASSFEAAYRLQPLPALLWNLGQTYQREFVIGQDPKKLARAIDSYRRYLNEAPNGANRDEATRLLTELVPVLARLAPEQMGARQPVVAPPPPVKTEIMVVTEAPAATVALDGAAPAAAPLLATVKVGEHRALVEAPGFFPAEVKVTAVDGRLVVGEARLIAQPARLKLVGDRGARVAIDGKQVGRLPLDALELTAGKHAVAVTARGHDAFARDVQLERGAELSLRAPLAPTTQRRAARWLLGVTCVSAVATVAAGAVWGQAEVSASSLYDQQQRSHLTMGELAQYNADRARRDDWRVGTFVALGLTAAIGGVTTALYVFDNPAAPTTAP